MTPVSPTETDRITAEPVVCKTFGCGRHLSPRERLFGDKCVNCQAVNQDKDVQVIIVTNWGVKKIKTFR